MLAGHALNTEFKPLEVSDTVAIALSRMDELDVDSLPVIEPGSKKLVGQLTRDYARSENHEDRLSEINLEEELKIFNHQHLFEAARMMLQYDLQFVSVVDKEMTFKGVVNKQKVLELLSGMLNLASFGSVISVELDKRDFSLAEIVHLIEQEEAKILGLTVETPDSDRGKFKVSIKLNLQNTARVTSALNRYGYTVTTENRNEVIGVDLESRADELIKYLDM